MRSTTKTTALCGSLLGLALSLPVQAQTYRHDGPAIGPQSSPTRAGTLIVIEQPEVTIESRTLEMRARSATSRDAAGLPTHGAPGTGDVDREIAMRRDEPFPRQRNLHRY